MKTRMTREQAVARITNGKFCTVVFAKREDNTIRKIHGRTGVRRFVTGAGARYNAKSHNLITFFDNIKEEYRNIPIERILSVNGSTVV